MARTLKIKWGDGESVDALLESPRGGGGVGVLLAHGAGAGQRHPFMETLRTGLAGAGLVAMSFDYSYIAQQRKAPDRAPKLLAVHAAAAERLIGYVDRIVLAGKSMGGRMGSHLVGDEGWPAAGLIYYGYPLVPVGKAEPRNTDHLERILVPQLFFAGTRDRLSPPAMIVPLSERLPTAQARIVDDADHSFNIPKRAPSSTEAAIATLIEESATFVGGLASDSA